MSTNRRDFLKNSLALGAGLSLAPTTTQAADPVKRNGKFHARLSIAAYSFRKYLGLNIKPKPPMDLFGFVDYAASLNLDAVEPTAYYFSDTSNEYLARLKGHCTRLGLDVSGTAVGNNFCFQDSKKLKAQLDMVKKWVEICSRLGGKTIRIFAGRLDKGDTFEKAQSRCITTIEEACEYAGKYGVILALENHGGITATSEQLLGIVKQVKSKWFGVNLDTGNFHSDDPYRELADIAPYAVAVQVKTEISRKGKKPEEADLSRFVDMLRKVNYRGYVALEYEAKEEPKTAIPGYVNKLNELLRA